MYVNAMVFENTKKTMNFLDEELIRENVSKDDERSFKKEVRALMKAMKTPFEQEVIFYKNGCKKIGMIK